MENRIAPEVADQEIEKILQFFDVRPEGEDWVEARKKLLRAAEDGRLRLDEGNEAVVLRLARPVELDNGETLSEVSFFEPSGADMKVLDKYRHGEQMAQSMHLISRMTGGKVPTGVVERFKARDITAAGALVMLFF